MAEAPSNRNDADTLQFAYSLDATSLGSGTWTRVAALDFTSPNNSPPGNKALDGNAAGNSRSVSFAITGLNIPAGSTFWFRWSDSPSPGSDDGLGIDNFAVVATPEPKRTESVAAGALLVFALVRRRRA